MPERIVRSVPVRAPRKLETRWPCPVCVAPLMEKVHVEGQGSALTLDYCPRCGGLWFERGEVGQLAARKVSSLHPYVPDRAERIRPPCVECHTPIDRDAERCVACGRRNTLACPVCDEPMERREHAGLVLDLCKRCHGIWFDNAELSAVWRVNLGKGGRAAGALAATGDVLVDAMFWSPHLVINAGMVAGEAAVQVAGATADAVGSAAEGVFGVVLEIIGGLFDGF